MAQYENYKLTYSLGFEKIPEEWNLKKVKYLFNIGRGRVISQEELMDNGLYPVFSSQTQNNGCLGYINTFDFDCEQLTWTTDGANAGTVFIRSGKHNCTNVCGTLQPIKNQAHLKFSHYALQYATQFHKRPDTNGAKIMNNEMAEISFALPSQQEQFKIVEYLNYETAQIDILIAKQEKLIELLKEKRQAVISHAVTKGLNPNVPMKDSGVEWLGEVPKHWSVSLIKYQCREITDGAHISPELENGEHLFISIRDIKEGVINFEDTLLTSEKSYQYLVHTGCKPFAGDILFSKDGTIGQTAITPSNINFVVASSLIIIRPNYFKVISEFLDLLLRSDVVQEQVESFVKGAALRRLSIQNLLKIWGVFPPIDEQEKIVEFVLFQLDKYKVLEDKAEKQVELLKERRTALISAAVTGKIDVRNWQAPTLAGAQTELSA